MSTAVRLDDKLVGNAERVGKLQNRSAPKQLEHWAKLGQMIADNISSNDLYALLQGVATVRIEMPEAKPISPEPVFTAVDQARDSGQLSNTVSRAAIQYQASPTHPGMFCRGLIGINYSGQDGEYGMTDIGARVGLRL